MNRKWLKRMLWTVVSVLGVAGLVWFAWPAPLAVDMATVARGPMEVRVGMWNVAWPKGKGAGVHDDLCLHL